MKQWFTTSKAGRNGMILVAAVMAYLMVTMSRDSTSIKGRSASDLIIRQEAIIPFYSSMFTSIVGKKTTLDTEGFIIATNGEPNTQATAGGNSESSSTSNNSSAASMDSKKDSPMHPYHSRSEWDPVFSARNDLQLYSCRLPISPIHGMRNRVMFTRNWTDQEACHDRFDSTSPAPARPAIAPESVCVSSPALTGAVVCQFPFQIQSVTEKYGTIQHSCDYRVYSQENYHPDNIRGKTRSAVKSYKDVSDELASCQGGTKGDDGDVNLGKDLTLQQCLGNKVRKAFVSRPQPKPDNGHMIFDSTTKRGTAGSSDSLSIAFPYDIVFIRNCSIKQLRPDSGEALPTLQHSVETGFGVRHEELSNKRREGRAKTATLNNTVDSAVPLPKHIVLFVIDAVSRANTMRLMKETRSLLQTLRKDRKAYVFGGYTAVNGFSEDNHMGYLTGYIPWPFEKYIPGVLTMKQHRNVIDRAMEYGMRTAIGSQTDWPEMMMHRRWPKRKWDHVMDFYDTLALPEEMTPKLDPLFTSKMNCFGHDQTCKKLFEYGNNVIDLYGVGGKNRKNTRAQTPADNSHWGKTSNSHAHRNSSSHNLSEEERLFLALYTLDLHQNNLDAGQRIDPHVAKGLKELREELDDSVIFLLSDHGSQWADSNLERGFAFAGERRLPVGGVLFGDTYAKRLTEQHHRNLFYNERAVITAVDFHRTILEMISPAAKPRWSPWTKIRGRSFFSNAIPPILGSGPTRDLSTTGIPAFPCEMPSYHIDDPLLLDIALGKRQASNTSDVTQDIMPHVGADCMVSCPTETQYREGGPEWTKLVIDLLEENRKRGNEDLFKSGSKRAGVEQGCLDFTKAISVNFKTRILYNFPTDRHGKRASTILPTGTQGDIKWEVSVKLNGKKNKGIEYNQVFAITSIVKTTAPVDISCVASEDTLQAAIGTRELPPGVSVPAALQAANSCLGDPNRAVSLADLLKNGTILPATAEIAAERKSIKEFVSGGRNALILEPTLPYGLFFSCMPPGANKRFCLCDLPHTFH